jgi:Cu2+-exporting ATPase
MHDHGALPDHQPAPEPHTGHEEHVHLEMSHPAPTTVHTGHTAAAEEAGHQAHAGHDAHTGHDAGGHAGHAEIYRRRFWITLILSIPVLLFSEMIQDWFNYSLPEFPGDNLVVPVFGTIVFLYGGSVFLTGGWQELRARKPGMMLLISLAIVVAFVASLGSISISGGSWPCWSPSCCSATGRKCGRSGRRREH